MYDILNLFPCPICKGKMHDVTEELELNTGTAIKCNKCGECFEPTYVRGFWAGYASAEKEIYKNA